MTANPPRAKATTLRDVARLAGVSMATASKALNGREGVSAATRERVREVAERISFTPNSLAQAMLAGQTGTVGLLTNDLEGRFSIPILMGAEDAFGAGQMSVFLCDARGDSIREQYHVKALLARRVDGLIVVGSQTDPRQTLGRELPVPVVYAYAPSEDPRDTSVVADNIAAGEMAAEHVIANGRTRIAHIGGDINYAAARDRQVGISRALAAAELTQVGTTRYGTWTESWGRAGARAIVEAGNDVDAIICDSDQIARGTLDYLQAKRVRVPEDIAVMSFDNWIPFAAGSRPRLSSVDMQFHEMGRLAAQLVVSALSGTMEPGVVSVTPRVVVRESTT